MKKQLIKILLFIKVFLISISFQAQTADDLLKMAPPRRLVNDFANILTSSQINELENKLVELDDSTSNQILVITINSLDGYDIADLAVEIGQKWGVGGEENDNGIVLLVKPKLSNTDKGKVYISIGYGLEDVIPDAVTKRIIENEIIPEFIDENYYGGINNAVNVLADLSSGKYSSSDYVNSDNSAATFVAILMIFIIVAIILTSTKGKKKGNGNNSGNNTPWIYFPHYPRSSGGGFSSGRSGGFGGFGGGSFGGGGAGGSW
ncbi:MAG: TPM domain-containing protein [Bacteroidales bacterium]|jgi:uncharacterized protein